MSGELPSLIRVFLALHVLGGIVALGTFLVPILVKKGGPTHVRFGKLYVTGMGVVIVTAFLVNPWRIAFDPAATAESQSFAAFLSFIAILSFAAISYALRALRHKRRSGPLANWVTIGPPAFLLVSAVAASAIGVITESALLTWFPVVGILTGIEHLRYWLGAPRSRMHWWYAHMSGMSVACISTVTAFLVTAAPRLLPGVFPMSLLLWLAPTLVTIPVFKAMELRYRRQFGE